MKKAKLRELLEARQEESKKEVVTEKKETKTKTKKEKEKK